MGITVRDAGGVSRTITRMKVLDGSTLRTIFRAKVMDADGVTLRTAATFTPPMTASASPTAVSGEVSSPSPTTVSTNPTSVTPSGGTGPYTYTWTVLTFGGPGSPTIGNATLATTNFSLAGVDASQTYDDATFRCTVTDAFGQTATADVAATFTNSFSS